MTAPTDTELDRQIDELLAMIRQNPEIKATEIGWESFDETLAEAKAQIKQLIARERLDELDKHGNQWRAWKGDTKSVKLADVINWYDIRIAELQAQADKEEQG